MLDINNESLKSSNVKAVNTYIIVSLLCVVINYIYSIFGHGVNSRYMAFMFLVPFIGGVFLFSVITYILKIQFIDRIWYNLYNSCVAAITIGCFLRGIYEIAGSDSKHFYMFWYLGAIFLMFSIIRLLYIRKQQDNKVNVMK